MELLDPVDQETALAGRADWFTEDTWRRLAEHPLESVDTEYPHHSGAVDGPDDTVHPKADHPVFYGCYDWHSAVHSHWSLIRQLRLADDHPEEAAIVESIDDRLTPENVAGERTYFEENPGFEQPYGWAWLLRLAAELQLWDDPRADRWSDALAPLETCIVDLVGSELLTQERPFRVGTHGNSAFALSGVLDYACVVGNEALADAATATAWRFYEQDEDAPVAYEPLGWDFLSPTLAEATLMRRVLTPAEFTDWTDGFLPTAGELRMSGFLDPVDVADDEDGVALHLVGLNVAKSWAFAGLDEALDDERAPLFREAAAVHLQPGVGMAFTDEYAGSHWLSSFVLYLLTRTDAGIAPSPV
ncbi:hypothetical protein Halar_2093 [halophilic archaeon DL31]|jgi:hypothetical protein|nr:hypothetical protein Halar_2093 [halophilic archaeon DL31]